MSVVDFSELSIIADIQTQVMFDSEAYGLVDGNGYVNVSLSDLTDPQDIAMVEPLYKVLNIEDKTRNFGSIKVTDGTCEPIYSPAIWSVEGKPCLRMGGYQFNLLIEDGNCFFESYQGDSKTQVLVKVPAIYFVGSYKNANNEEIKTLNFSISIENGDPNGSDDDNDLIYTFRTLFSDAVKNPNNIINNFTKFVRSNKADKAIEALNDGLRTITFSKKLNLNKTSWLFKTPGLFEKLKSLYPNGKLSFLCTGANYCTDSKYGDYIELEVDFSYYTSKWGEDPIVNAQGKTVNLSEVRYLVIKANQYANNNVLKMAYAKKSQSLWLFSIVAPNEKNIENYPKYTCVDIGSVSQDKIPQFMAYALNPTIPQKEVEASKKPVTFRLSGDYQKKAESFSFE